MPLQLQPIIREGTAPKLWVTFALPIWQCISGREVSVRMRLAVEVIEMTAIERNLWDIPLEQSHKYPLGGATNTSRTSGTGGAKA